MTLDMVANHLWQSTLFAAAASVIALALRKNRAEVRYRVWLAASLKFLLPFAVLITAGSHVGWRSSSVVQPRMALVIETVSQPFSGPALAARVPAPATATSRIVAALPFVVLIMWACGCAAIVLTWCVRWRRVAGIVRDASPVSEGPELQMLRDLEAIGGTTRPMALVSTEASMEPGVFGIVTPALLWPRTIVERLDNDQVAAILAHEVAHVQRRDNLAAAAHMVVEALFWFHPLVWWLGDRLVDERERACDEAVIRCGADPQVYAESILKTCQFYVESPLTCVAGVTGSNLKKRVEQIMKNDYGHTLDTWKKLLLTSAGVVTVAAPFIIGALSPQPVRAQAADAGPGFAFEVADVKPNKSGDGASRVQNLPGGRLNVTNVPLSELIRLAYGIQDFQLVDAPDWISKERFDIVAKGPDGLPPAPNGPPPGAAPGLLVRGPMMKAMQGLLQDRFKLKVHNETRELPIYALVLAKKDGSLGPRIHPPAVDCAALATARGRTGGPPSGPPPPPPPFGERVTCGMRTGLGQLSAGGVTLSQLAPSLGRVLRRVVIDRTELTGTYDLELTWTPDQLPPRAPGTGPEQPIRMNGVDIDPDGPSIFTAVQEQLGLKLESTRGPVDVVVIDSVDRPTEN